MKPKQSFPFPPGARLTLLGAALALSLAGCASSSGIDPVARPVTAAEVGLAAGDAAIPVTTDWWTAWGDEGLNRLMAQALQAQPNLKVAQARLTRAQALVQSEEAAASPRLNGSADATREHFSANSIYPAPLGGSIRTLGNLQMAGGWELDFFGKHRAAIEAAAGQSRAAAADLQAARNLLTSQVAQAWVQLARLLAQREVAERSLHQREEMLALTRQRVQAGLDTQVELRQGEGALPDTRQQIEQIDEQIALTRHALAALAALPPQGAADATPQLTSLPAPVVPQSLPADLLGRRPDVMAARWRMEAATQGVKLAQAQFYPNVNLTVFAGFSSIGLDELIQSGSRQYGAGPAIHLPIFDAGALRANLRGRTADLDAAIESYNGAVLEALRDTADQLSSLQSLQRQQALQAKAQAAAESAYEIALQRYRAGISAQLTVLGAETAVLAQRRLAVDLRARELAARIGLARALGGGFPVETPAS